jgi:hypothetical protein
MSRTYAVVWSDNGSTASGRLDAVPEGLELRGRDLSMSIRFAELTGATIARGRSDRLRGLPVLELDRSKGAPVRIASLEGTSALYEICDLLGRAGVTARGKAA